MAVTVDGCPCGASHEIPGELLAAYKRVTAQADPLVTVTVPGAGSWVVPRLFVLCHVYHGAIRGSDWPVLAAQYGFPPAEQGPRLRAPGNATWHDNGL